MDSLMKDVRYGIRMLTRNPAFTAVAVIALALGIGANAAIFSVVNAVLLRPLPFADPDRLMVLRETKLPQFPEFSVAPANFMEWQKQNTVFERMAAFQNSAYNLIGVGEPERLQGMRVSDGFLAMLGVQPARGRDFLPEEDQPGHNQVVIISDGLWQRRFGGDPNILNQAITLNGNSYTVVGIMPADFRFGGSATDIWSPTAFDAKAAQQHGSHYVAVIGRLRPGVSVEQARAEMSAIAERLAAQYPDQLAGWNVKVVPMLEFTVRSIKLALYVLMGAVLFVLLIACVNVANLLLARAASRQKEVAIRTALGAGRRRIVRQLLTESVILAIVGGTVGLFLAIWGKDVLLALAPEDLPRVREASLDARVLVFTIGITLLTGVIFGLVPALQASKPNLNETLKDAGRGSTEGGRRHLLRSILVVVEVATALVLLVAAGLMIKSFWRLQHVDPGFNSDHALMAKVALPSKKYATPEQQIAFFNELLEKVSRLPGVEAAGASVVLPMDDDYVLGFDVEGRPPVPGEDESTNYYSVTPDYFKAMGIPLRQGRLFDDRDQKNSPRVIIINESMARRLFPDENPVGKRIYLTQGKEKIYREVVGVVGDVKQYGLDQTTPLESYEPFAQQPFNAMALVVRAGGDPTQLSAAIRGEVLSIDKEQPVSSIKPLTALVSSSISQQRFAMLLLGVLAAVALLLAAVGIYGVMSYSVTQRTHEIGIRLALGASSRDILRLVVGHGLMLTLVGVVAGLGAAFLLMKIMATLLFGVSATDFATFVIFSASLTVVALAACLVPARRALRVDPMVALRYE
jgi:putative ABC transport system permease protein